MANYLGMTKSDLEVNYIYDKDEGRVYTRRERKEVGTPTASGLVHKRRCGDKTVTISLGKLCYFLEHEVTLVAADKILYRDGNFYNLKPENLEAVRYISNRPEGIEPYIEVEERIFYDPNTTFYVVRRGPTQAVYRTFDLKEAISIRNEWKNDNSIHKWDKSVKYDRFL
jgi:hypothetical protein